jgi:hypothetical protein
MIIFLLVILRQFWRRIMVSRLCLGCIFWGRGSAWACALYFPLFGRRHGDEDPRLKSGLEEFRSETREIARDLGEFNYGTGRELPSGAD